MPNPEIENNAGAFLENPASDVDSSPADSDVRDEVKTATEKLSDEISQPKGICDGRKNVAELMIEKMGNSPAFAFSFAQGLSDDEVKIFADAQDTKSLLECCENLSKARVRKAKPKKAKG